MIKERDYLWDNIKAFLITTVVVGHVLPALNLTSTVSISVTYFIFSFHMPAFVFVSGYFAKNYCKNGVVRGEKAAVLAGYYIVFQLLFFLLYQVINPISFTLFNPFIGLWYLLAMVIYYLMVPVFEKLPWYITIPIFIALGLFIGVEKYAGTFFAISRTFAFAPFFFAGYYTQKDLIDKLRSFKFHNLIGGILILLSVGIMLLTKIAPYRYDVPISTFWAKSTYNGLHQSNLGGMFLRAEGYVFAALIIIGLIMLFPKRKTIFSYIGKNSLQIYVLHMPIIILMKSSTIFDFAKAESELHAVILIFVGIALTLLLSINIFSYPFKWIQMGVNKLYSLNKIKT